ncbi:hypothetical protein [Kribbella sancticallisti]
MVCAYSHHGRVRSEAAFACLGGIAHCQHRLATPAATAVSLR